MKIPPPAETITETIAIMRSAAEACVDSGLPETAHRLQDQADVLETLLLAEKSS